MRLLDKHGSLTLIGGHVLRSVLCFELRELLLDALILLEHDPIR